MKRFALILPLLVLTGCVRAATIDYLTSLAIAGQSDLIVDTDDSSLAAHYAAAAALSAGTIVHNATGGSITGGTYAPVLDADGNVADVAHVAGLADVGGASFGTPVQAFAFGIDPADGAWRIWTTGGQAPGDFQVIGSVEAQSQELALAITQLQDFDLSDQFDPQFSADWMSVPLINTGANNFFLLTTDAVKITGTVPEPGTFAISIVAISMLCLARRRRAG